MMFVARLLGQQQYGQFNAAQSVVQLGAVLITLGLQPTLVKYTAQFRHEKKPGHLKVIIETGILLSLVANITARAQSLTLVAMGITSGHERMEFRASINLVYSIIKRISSPVLVFIGYGTLGAVIGHALPQTIAGLYGVVLIVLLYRQLSSTDAPFSHLEAAKLLLGYGWPIYLSSILGASLPHMYTTLVARALVIIQQH